jgi:CHASE2 domain-containing sensor protein
MPSPPDFTEFPFKGLQPYTEADREYFFGRERDKIIIASNLIASPLTILYGASGVGKTSVLMAAVTPYLKAIPHLTTVIFRSWQSTELSSSLRAEVLKVAGQGGRQAIGQAAIKDIDLSTPLDEFLIRYTDISQSRILFIFDQFEEYFINHPASPQVEHFEAEFARVVNRREVDAHFLISLREEELSKLDRFQGRIPNLFSNHLRVARLDRKAAEDAIRKPLEVYNRKLALPEGGKVSIEDELVSALLDKASLRNGSPTGEGAYPHRAQPGTSTAGIETPVLQILLTRLWHKEKSQGSNVMRLQTFNEQLGGAEKIVSTYFSEVMNGLTEREREIAASIFQFLVTPSGTKIALEPKTLSSWANLNGEQAQLQVTALLEKLSSYQADSTMDGRQVLQGVRVLRKVTAPNQPERYEIFHDVLAPSILEWRAQYLQARQLEVTEKKRVHAELRFRNLRHWTRILIIIFVGMLIGDFLAEQGWWRALQFKVDQSLQNLRPRAPLAETTALVLIDDEEYWGELGGRAPLRRDYLAKIIRAVDAAGPSVIAIDFDLRSTSPEGRPIEFPEYLSETKYLVAAIKDASRHCTVVLPRTIGLDEDQLTYSAKADIYDGYDFEGGDVQAGYIALSDDIREIPLSLKTKGGGTIDSFSQVITRAYAGGLPIPKSEALVYGGFLRPEAFFRYSSKKVLEGEQGLLEPLKHKIVIIGGAWHTRSFNSGEVVDNYETPAGRIPGAIIQANYVEALLSGRAYVRWDSVYLTLVKIILASVFALLLTYLKVRVSYRVPLLLLFLLGIIAANYTLAPNQLLSIDVFLPIILLFFHFLFEEMVPRLYQRADGWHQSH